MPLNSTFQEISTCPTVLKKVRRLLLFSLFYPLYETVYLYRQISCILNPNALKYHLVLIVQMSVFERFAPSGGRERMGVIEVRKGVVGKGRFC